MRVDSRENSGSPSSYYHLRTYDGTVDNGLLCRGLDTLAIRPRDQHHLYKAARRLRDGLYRRAWLSIRQLVNGESEMHSLRQLREANADA